MRPQQRKQHTQPDNGGGGRGGHGTEIFISAPSTCVCSPLNSSNETSAGWEPAKSSITASFRMLHLPLSYRSISLAQSMKDRDCSGGKKSRSVRQRSVKKDACRVMSTFQHPSPAVTQGHVGTVAPGPHRKQLHCHCSEGIALL